MSSLKKKIVEDEKSEDINGRLVAHMLSRMIINQSDFDWISRC